jgi:hypothetical protein
VNYGGAPSAARKGEFPCKAGQSWWPLLTGNGGDLSRPVPGVRLVPSRPAVSFGEGGTVAPRKMVPPRVWIPMRASCSPSTTSRVKSRPDAMAGFSARSCVNLTERISKFPNFPPRGEDRGANIALRKQIPLIPENPTSIVAPPRGQTRLATGRVSTLPARASY